MHRHCIYVGFSPTQGIHIHRKDFSSSLYNHNSGYGSSSTQPYHLRLFAVMAYISGFGDDYRLMLAVERKWKQRRDHMIHNGILDPRQWAMQGDDMSADRNLSNHYDMPRLTLHLLFKS